MSTQNMKKTMKALVALGLNLNTGKSRAISVPTLEKYSGVRQNSNGMRIIRDDAPPFNAFKIERSYDPVSALLLSVKFSGYRDAEYEVEREHSTISKQRKEITSLQNSIQKHAAEALRLKALPPKTKLYGKADVVHLIK